jgi:hypothetical protein
MKRIILLFTVSLIAISCKNEEKDIPQVTGEDVMEGETAATEEPAEIKINPISHATAVINWGETVIYLDPVGGAEAFAGMDQADMVLITDIHGDHMSAETLGALNLNDIPVIAPQAVKDELPDSLATKISVMENGSSRYGIDHRYPWGPHERRDPGSFKSSKYSYYRTSGCKR